MNIGDALARKGQPDEAMVHFEQAIKLQPDYAEAYYNRGNVLYTKGRIDEAIADFEKLFKSNPTTRMLIRALVTRFRERRAEGNDRALQPGNGVSAQRSALW